MCKVTKDGYILKDGTKIPYDVDITTLEISSINSLNNEPGTKWDTYILHVGLRELTNKIEGNFEKVMEAIETSKDVHFDSCPFNRSGITELVDERVIELSNNGLGEVIREKVDEHLKGKGIRAYKGFKGFLRDFILIAASVSAGVGLFKILGG